MSQLEHHAQIAGVRAACRAAARTLEMIAPQVRAGVDTATLDRICHDFIVKKLAGRPASLGYHDFPKSICTSRNHIVCHGIPDPGTRLKNGDILNVDVAVELNGFYGDSSRMFIVGTAKPWVQKLVRICYEALFLSIREVRPGAHLGNLGAVIQQHAERHGFSVVQEYCGHGTGLHYHDKPEVLHFGVRGQGARLQPGMCLTIEPMINAGVAKTQVLKDGWTVITADGKPSAQWEHTVLVTNDGYEILTLRSDEQSPI